MSVLTKNFCPKFNQGKKMRSQFAVFQRLPFKPGRLGCHPRSNSPDDSRRRQGAAKGCFEFSPGFHIVVFVGIKQCTVWPGQISPDSSCLFSSLPFLSKPKQLRIWQLHVMKRRGTLRNVSCHILHGTAHCHLMTVINYSRTPPPLPPFFAVVTIAVEVEGVSNLAFFPSHLML